MFIYVYEKRPRRMVEGKHIASGGAAFGQAPEKIHKLKQSGI